VERSVPLFKGYNLPYRIFDHFQLLKYVRYKLVKIKDILDSGTVENDQKNWYGRL